MNATNKLFAILQVQSMEDVFIFLLDDSNFLPYGTSLLNLICLLLQIIWT